MKLTERLKNLCEKEDRKRFTGNPNNFHLFIEEVIRSHSELSRSMKLVSAVWNFSPSSNHSYLIKVIVEIDGAEDHVIIYI